MVEIPRKVIDPSEYIVYQTPDPTTPGILSTQHTDEGQALALSVQDDIEREERDIEGSNSQPEIQVPHTQVPKRGRREVPDSQSSGRVSIHFSPVTVPETPQGNRAVLTISTSPRGALDPIEEIDAVVNLNISSQPDRSDPFVYVPDSSNKIFSQDVRELESQSQSSKEGSQNSIPSGQLSVCKVGVDRSHESFLQEPVASLPNNVHPEGPRANGNASVEAESNEAKSVVCEAAPTFSGRSDEQPFQQHTQTSSQLQSSYNPLEVQSQSSSEGDNDREYNIPNSDHEPLLEIHSPSEFDNFNTRQARASHFCHRESVLQQAVESERPSTVDSLKDPGLEPSSQPAQLGNPLSDNNREGPQGATGEETIDSSNRNLQSFKPLTYSTNFNTFPPSLLSPRTPIQEDPLESVRSTSSTPCGPIPASATPAPVTVLGYFPSERKRPVTSQEEAPSSSPSERNILSSSSALHRAISEFIDPEVSKSPSRETRSTRRRKKLSSSGGEIMSGAPASPLKATEVANSFEHHLNASKDAAVPTSQELLSSPRVLQSPIEESLLAQANSIDAKANSSTQERTPISEDLPSVDEDLLAGSQALNLLRSPAKSSSTEFFLAIPLTEIQKGIYVQTLLDRYRSVETFFGLQGTQVSGDVSVESMEAYIAELDGIASHADIADVDPLELEGSKPELVDWFCTQSSKFAIFSTLLNSFRDETCTIAVVVEEGKLMGFLKTFLKCGGYSFTRLGENRAGTKPLSESQHDGLHVVLVPSHGDIEETSLPASNLIIGFDSTLDSTSSRVRLLQRNETSPFDPATIIHLVPINTVAHIALCLPSTDETDARDYVTAILFAALLIRDEAGVLPSDLFDQLDALASSNPFAWLENLQKAQERLLPPLKIAPPSTQNELNSVETGVTANSPARKRVLSWSTLPTSPGGKHKKARIGSGRTSPRSASDIPMAGYETAPARLEDAIQVAGSQSVEMAPPTPEVADKVGDVTHITETIPALSEAPSQPILDPVNEDTENAPRAPDVDENISVGVVRTKEEEPVLEESEMKDLAEETEEEEEEEEEVDPFKTFVRR
ncbi:hypothetical protein ABW19_dt0200804 [Dactylella cylindrospora]|nr:hypothetical protein ABW19_dt0200804 [Dactylella cylindrospora]